jgi:uncharacterized protein (DUF924 family)
MRSDTRMDNILHFWFGRVEETIIPSEHRAKIWFGEDMDTDTRIRDEFLIDLESAIDGRYQDWESTPRGQLALIILLDQFSRHIFRNNSQSYTQDETAVRICLNGIERGFDHQLSLIERVFFYFPLLHSEDRLLQERSVKSYELLSKLAFAETKVIFESFVKFANHHFSVIDRFGRFPQRNKLLQRGITPNEQSYLNDVQE